MLSIYVLLPSLFIYINIYIKWPDPPRAVY